MKVVKILWEDSCNSNLNWVTKEDVEVELVNIDSFGVVVKETDEFVSIAQNYGSEPEQFSNIVTIPRGCIKEIFVIHDDNYVRQGEQKPAEKPVWHDNMDDLIADGMIDEIQKSDLPEGSKHNRIYWINKHRVQPKQEWSEEDSMFLQACIRNIEQQDPLPTSIYSDCIKWLKSLKGKYVPQQPKTEWSEEDREYIDYINVLVDNAASMCYGKKVKNWLKSLKDRVQPKQEWSEEDEQVIEDAETWLDTLCDYLKDFSSECIPTVKNVISKLKSLRQK